MKNTTTENFKHGIAKPMLCDGFLVPMTDFVIKMMFSKNYPNHKEALKQIFSYAEFLKQPLKLEMFVPCVEGEPIEYVELKKTGGKLCQVGSEIEKKAKEKVLFELNSTVAVETMNYHISRNRNIEYLANFGSIKLTQNSLNAIFG